MAKIQIKSETRHELSFFPNSFDDYVPKDSKVRMVDRIVRSMDINPLMDTYAGTGELREYENSLVTFKPFLDKYRKGQGLHGHRVVRYRVQFEETFGDKTIKLNLGSFTVWDNYALL